MRRHLRGNSGVRLLAILMAAALTLGSLDVTALASAAGQAAAQQTAVEPENTEGQAQPENPGEQPGEDKNAGDKEAGVTEGQGDADAEKPDAEKDPENADPNSDPEQNADTPADDAALGNPEAADGISGEQADELAAQSAAEQAMQVTLYGRPRAESGRMAYLDPTVLRPESTWSEGGNTLWLGKDKEEKPMQYRILSSMDYYETATKNQGLLLDSVKQNTSWWTNYTAAATLSSLERGAIAKWQNTYGGDRSPFELSGTSVEIKNALFADEATANASYGQMLYINLDKVLMVSQVAKMKYMAGSAIEKTTVTEESEGWKLTLLDSSKSVKDATITYQETTTDGDVYQISCTYKGESDDKLSVMITDKPYTDREAEILAYGYINEAWPEATNSKTELSKGEYELKGTFRINADTGVSQETLKKYYMYLIVESTAGTGTDQGKYGSDYASEPYQVQLGEVEKHYACGYTGTKRLEHEKLHPSCGWSTICTFKPWNQTNSLPSKSGNYYLVNDVVLTETWKVPEGNTYLCLSGKSITMQGDGAVISVTGDRVNFLLTDCQNEENRITHSEGHQGSGIEISDKGDVDLYSIKITGNRGAGVDCKKAFSDNFSVRRDTIIEGNTASDGTTPNNVYLGKDQRIYVFDPGEKMRIGVTTAVTPTEEKPVAITLLGRVTDANYIFSDQNYDIGHVEETYNGWTRQNLTFVPRATAITAMDKDGTATTRSLGLGTDIMRNPAIPKENEVWSGSYVWFGYSHTYNASNNPGQPVKYRVLSKNTTELGKNKENTLFLDSDCLMIDERKYSVDSSSGNAVISYMSSFYNYAKEAEQKALAISSITETGKENYPFFILTEEQAKSGRYGYSNSDTGKGRIKYNRYYDRLYKWWLHGGESYVTTDGVIMQGNDVNAGGGIATNVNLSNILLSEVTAGEAGKLNAEYKLTLLAGKQDDGTENMKIDSTNVQRTEDEVTVTYDLSHYAKAIYPVSTTYYRINQVSVLFLDKEYTEGNTNNAKLLGYAKIDEKEFTDYPSIRYDGGLNGSYTNTFTVPAGLENKKCGVDYHAYLIAEQINGEHESNFASDPVEITIPKGSYGIKHQAKDTTLTYDTDNEPDVTTLFTLDSRIDAATASYELLTEDGVTGEGTLSADNKLNVTKCGVFKIKVTTPAVNDSEDAPLYGVGTAIATLTVNRAEGSMADVKVANTDSAKTAIIYGDTWTVSTTSTTNTAVSYTYWLSSGTEADAIDTQPTDAGTYTVRATYAATDLYESCSKTAEFTILPRPVALQWSETKLTYTGNEQSVTATITNKVSTDTDDNFKLEYTGNTKTEVGNYTAQVTALGNPNYTLDGAADVKQTWSIRYLNMPATPYTVKGTEGTNGWYVSKVRLKAADGYLISTDSGKTWQNGFDYTVSWIYPEEDYSLKQKATGYITAPGTLPTIKVDLTAPTGKLQINTKEIEQTDNILWKWFFKEKAIITVTVADTVSGVAKLEYQSVNALGGYQENGYWKELDDSNSLTIPANASQTLYFKITDKAGNATILNSNGVVVYTDATATGEVNFVKTTTADQDTGINVSDNAIASIKEGTEIVANGAYRIEEVNGENHLILTAAYLKSLTDGTHTLTVEYDANGHAWAEDSDGEKPTDSTITVGVMREQGFVTIRGELSKVYDGRPVSRPGITTENDRGTNNANVTMEYKVKGADDSTYTKEAPKDYGTYVVRVTVAADASHTEAVATKEFSITKKRMTWTAKDYSGTYDGQNHGITVTVTEPADAVISYRASEEASWQSEPITYGDAGTYTVYYQVTGENYETETGSRTITIMPKTVALTWGTTTFTYDGTEKIPAVSVNSSALCEGDTCEVTGVKGAQKAAGTYTAEAIALDNANYQLPGDATIAFTIEKATVTIQADDKQKHEETADPELTWSITEGSLAEGDSLNGITVSRAKGEAAGTYELTAALAADVENSNYQITISDKAGTFTIEAHDQAKVSREAVAPTCTRSGSTEERSCSVCEKVMTASVEIPALGHDWIGEWKVVKEATATEAGRQEKTCGREGCGQKMYEVIPATGQSPDEDGTGQGDLRVDLEVSQDAPIASGGIYNTKKELLDAPGIFGEAEKAAIAEGKEAKVWVEITKADLSEEEKAAFEQEAKKTAGDNAKLVYFSAELFCQIGEDVERISEPGAKLRLTIRIPDELLNTDSTISREYFILRMHDGELSVLNGSFDKDTKEYTFETDRFSDYAIVCKDTKLEIKPEEKPTPKPDDKKTGSSGGSGGSSKAPVTSANTGDQNQPLAWMLLALAAMGIITAMIWRKKRQ